MDLVDIRYFKWWCFKSPVVPPSNPKFFTSPSLVDENFKRLNGTVEYFRHPCSWFDGEQGKIPMPHNDSQRAQRISTFWWISNGTSIVLKKTSTAVGNKAWFTPLRNIENLNMSDLVVPQLDSPFEPGKDAYNTSWLKLSFHTILLWPERNQKDEGAANVAPKLSLENHLEKSHIQSSQNQRT